MRPLALTAALATALAGTGCIVTPVEPVGDLDLAWQFRNSDGITTGAFVPGNTGCEVAAVTDVRLVVTEYATGRTVLDRFFPCADGTGYPRAFVTGLAIGSYDYTAQAWRVDAPVFSTTGAFNVYDGEITQQDATLDVVAVAPLTVYFTQNGAATCSGTPEIWYSAFYPANATTAFDTAYVPCTSSYGFTIAADQITGRTYGFDIAAVTSPGHARVNEQCFLTVRHTGFPATVNLVDAAVSACP